MELGDNIYIIIEDDGVVFDTKAKKEDGHSHLGIKTVRERLRVMCNGDIMIESEFNQGTTVTIMIPK